MIERNIARIALPKMLVGLFVARVDDGQMEESRETTKEARCSRRDSPAYFLPHPNLGSFDLRGAVSIRLLFLCQTAALRRRFRRLRPERLSAMRRPHPARCARLVSGVLHSLGNGGTGA